MKFLFTFFLFCQFAFGSTSQPSMQDLMPKKNEVIVPKAAIVEKSTFVAAEEFAKSDKKVSLCKDNMGEWLPGSAGFERCIANSEPPRSGNYGNVSLDKQSNNLFENLFSKKSSAEVIKVETAKD